VISDTHLPRGSRRLSDECLALLRSAALILHGGDVSTEAALAELRMLGPPVEAVYGNADERALKDTLPAELIVEVGRARIGMIHIPGPAADRERRLLRRFPGCEAVVYGHTHRPQVERVDGVWILNPGSPTERRRAQSRSLLVLELEGRKLEPKLVTIS
jgi:putative phosphoesterase